MRGLRRRISNAADGAFVPGTAWRRTIHRNPTAIDEFYRRWSNTMGFDTGLPLPIVVATGIMLFVVLTLYAVANADEA